MMSPLQEDCFKRQGRKDTMAKSQAVRSYSFALAPSLIRDTSYDPTAQIQSAHPHHSFRQSVK